MSKMRVCGHLPAISSAAADLLVRTMMYQFSITHRSTTGLYDEAESNKGVGDWEMFWSSTSSTERKMLVEQVH